MKIEFSITKQHIVSLVLAIAIVAGISYAVAQSSAPDPGHSPSEIGPGAFYGSSSDTWSFPGKVGIGTTSPSEKLHVDGKLRVGDTEIYDNEINRVIDASNKILYLGHSNTDEVVVSTNMRLENEVSGLSGSIVYTNCAANSNNHASCTADCPSGYKVIGGGCSAEGSYQEYTFVGINRPTDSYTGWVCKTLVDWNLGGDTKANGYAICLKE